MPKKRCRLPFVWVVNSMAIKSAIHSIYGLKHQQKGEPAGSPSY
ncbi:hypothetical protein AXX16_3956 [Serratia rubidaea]|nr:hypothetical protein AXX16_3956 [Serratia rubidaea]